jgi:hypothetical protein
LPISASAAAARSERGTGTRAGQSAPAGFAVQTWSGPDWLRVDFSSGSQVSSLIASWNGHPPSVVVTP